ncbi:MAG: type II toxin-antitoxin system Phd/YefM family antitoxin [Deltaproteobacteria bacterium]|nr:type II toxin-antitoxin system Phd/YefM family antitoxin [Deltaproteobacteria bacterium]
MISAGIKEVKNNLSRLLARVKAGEEVLITERGRPVARIVKENVHPCSIVAFGPERADCVAEPEHHERPYLGGRSLGKACF